MMRADGANLSVVGGRMMFGRVVSEVGLCRFPVDLELALFYSVLHPVKAVIGAF